MSGVALLQSAAAAALNGSVACLTGVLMVRIWLTAAASPLAASPLAASPFHTDMCIRLRHCALGSGAVGMAALTASMWAAAAIMGGTDLAQAAAMLMPVLTGTAYGHAGLVALAAVAVLALTQAMRGQGAAIGGAAALLCFALARASISHAGEDGMASLAYAIEVAHIVLVALWLGGVWLAAWLVLPAARALSSAIPSYLASLSAWATVALAGLLASGGWNTWQRISAPRQLLDNDYGVALSVKLGLFAVAALLGAYNRFVGFPLAARDRGDRALVVLRVESVVLVAVLVVAAYLSVQPPPT